MGYTCSSILMLVGAVVLIVSFVVFQAPIGTVVGGFVFLLGCFINPARLTTLKRKTPADDDRED